jgi:hypothetical protein
MRHLLSSFKRELRTPPVMDHRGAVYRIRFPF